MNISELECLNESDDLVNVSADWQIVNSHVSQCSISIDDIGGSKSDTNVIIFDIAVVCLADLMVDVREHWDVHWSETTLLSILHSPLSMGEVRIDGA